MKFLYCQLIIVMFFFGCGSKEHTTTITNSKNEELTDSVKTKLPANIHGILKNPLVDSLLNYFLVSTQLPMSISSENIDSLIPKVTLKTYEVRKLSNKFIKNNFSKKCQYSIEQFYKIDSIKENGDYKSWKHQTEIGEIINAEAYPIYKIKIDENNYLLFWMLQESTAEACPYSWLRSVFVTVIFNNKIKETILFAEHMGSGDAPVSYDKKITGSISKDLTFYLESREELDEDEPLVKLTECNFDLKLDSGIFKYTDQGTKVIKKVKRNMYNK
ncbi:MAG: hypothetical protein SFY56_08710 [Bacteroidota bacterium]|nr:hypothetical protein [Bacteroidota bacterium]